MKRSILTLLIIITITVVIATGIVAFAELNSNPNSDIKITDSGQSEISEIPTGVPQTRIYTSGDGEKVQLNYKTTSYEGGFEPNNVYVDNQDNEYCYDFNGNLIDIMFHPKNSRKNNSYSESENVKSENKQIDIDTAIDIAQRFATENYGKAFSGMSLYDAIPLENDEMYYITFSRNYGENGFVCGEICTALIRYSGEVYSCGIPNAYKFDNFDNDLLEGVSQKNVISFVEKRMSDIFKNLNNYEITGIFLTMIDGKYNIAVYTKQTTKEPLSSDIIETHDISVYLTNGEFLTGMFHYYPLEK